MLALLVLALVLAGCSGGGGGSGAAATVFSPSGMPSDPAGAVNPSPTATRVAEAAPALGPDGRATPRPDRPVVQLRFDLTGWRAGAVTGSEDVRFTPDLRACELVFRLWPNKPTTAAAGDRLTITRATVAGTAVKVQLQTVGGKDGAATLAQLPLASCAAPGTAIRIHLDFGLKLGTDVAERVGRAGDGSYAWLGSAFPLLAWEHGAGWMRDPAVDVRGETAGSEDFDLRSLDITAPRGDQVQGVGQPVVQRRPYDGLAHFRFTARAVRDVLVTVGRFTVRETDVGDVHLHLATHTGMQASRRTWLAMTRSALTGLPDLLGPFPYGDVWLTVTEPQLGGGIEYPGAALLGDVRTDGVQALVTHELAHSYFYGLVGNDQGRDPWLDESFASWAESVVDHQPAPEPPPDAPDGKVGEPMAYWAQQPDPDRTYVESVYGWGALALTEARAKVGPKVFDAAIARYLAVNAHRIARPQDVAAAFAHQPVVLTVLRNAGALPG